MIVEFLQIQIPPDRTSGTRTCATQMLTNTIVEICSTPLTTGPRRTRCDVVEVMVLPQDNSTVRKVLGLNWDVNLGPRQLSDVILVRQHICQKIFEQVR